MMTNLNITTLALTTALVMSLTYIFFKRTLSKAVSAAVTFVLMVPILTGILITIIVLEDSYEIAASLWFWAVASATIMGLSLNRIEYVTKPEKLALGLIAVTVIVVLVCLVDIQINR